MNTLGELVTDIEVYTMFIITTDFIARSVTTSLPQADRAELIRVREAQAFLRIEELSRQVRMPHENFLVCFYALFRQVYLYKI
jgi:hypothetical protein